VTKTVIGNNITTGNITSTKLHRNKNILNVLGR
jgi:hypothetical protein